MDMNVASDEGENHRDSRKPSRQGRLNAMKLKLNADQQIYPPGTD